MVPFRMTMINRTRIRNRISNEADIAARLPRAPNGDNLSDLKFTYFCARGSVIVYDHTRFFIFLNKKREDFYVARQIYSIE